jgi:hypothetical protein
LRSPPPRYKETEVVAQWTGNMRKLVDVSSTGTKQHFEKPELSRQFFKSNQLVSNSRSQPHCLLWNIEVTNTHTLLHPFTCHGSCHLPSCDILWSIGGARDSTLFSREQGTPSIINCKDDIVSRLDVEPTPRNRLSFTAPEHTF